MFFLPRTEFVDLLSLRVMRNARPFLLVALYLTAFVGYFFKCIVVCCSFVLSFLSLSLEDNVLIVYCINVGGVHDTCALSFLCADLFRHSHRYPYET